MDETSNRYELNKDSGRISYKTWPVGSLDPAGFFDLERWLDPAEYPLA